MAQFQDWENIIYIEPRIISKAIEWLIKYQTPSGAFMETPAYQAVPLDKKADAYVSSNNCFCFLASLYPFLCRALLCFDVSTASFLSSLFT